MIQPKYFNGNAQLVFKFGDEMSLFNRKAVTLIYKKHKTPRRLVYKKNL